MTDFLQLHLLTCYPPSNLNRDDLGRPKSAFFGGALRLRISSQALKRTWRKSKIFEDIPDGLLGERTRRMGRNIALSLKTQHNVDDGEADKIARVIASIFGKLDDKPKPGQELFIKQLAFISPSEMNKLDAYLDKTLKDKDLRAALVAAADDVSLAGEVADDGDEDEDDVMPKSTAKKKKRSEKTTKLLKQIREEIMSEADMAVDIAMFGRMLAETPRYNREAAVQVAHALTTHKVILEDDYYSAVDDLNEKDEDAGAGFLGEAGFGAGVFYLYACIDRDLLRKNLGGDETLAGAAIAALVEAAATVAPGGKQASFASRARASFILAEHGTAQPRSLSVAFLKPVSEQGGDMMASSITALLDTRDKIDAAYGKTTTADKIMNVPAGEGTLAEILAFCRDAG